MAGERLELFAALQIPDCDGFTGACKKLRGGVYGHCGHWTLGRLPFAWEKKAINTQDEV